MSSRPARLGAALCARRSEDSPMRRGLKFACWRDRRRRRRQAIRRFPDEEGTEISTLQTPAPGRIADQKIPR